MVLTKSTTTTNKKLLHQLIRYSRVFILVILFALFSLTTDTFFSFSNMNNVMVIVTQQAPFLIVLSICMTMAIVLNGINNAIGAILALSSCCSAVLMLKTDSIILGAAAGLAIGAAFGALSGFMIAKLNITPFIATYTVQWIATGLAYVLLGGSKIYMFPAGFREMFTGWRYTFLLLAAIIALLVWFLMSQTIFGRNMYVVGSNVKVAKLSGVNTTKVIMITYILSGALSAFTGLMYIANLGAAEPLIGSDFPLKTVAASLIGGVAFGGGKGNVINSVIGSFIMVTIMNGLVHIGMPSYWQDFSVGFAIIISIFMEKAIQKITAEK